MTGDLSVIILACACAPLTSAIKSGHCGAFTGGLTVLSISTRYGCPCVRLGKIKIQCLREIETITLTNCDRIDH